MPLPDCLSNEHVLLTVLTKRGPRAGRYHLTAPQQDCWR